MEQPWQYNTHTHTLAHSSSTFSPPFFLQRAAQGRYYYFPLERRYKHRSRMRIMMIIITICAGWIKARQQRASTEPRPPIPLLGLINFFRWVYCTVTTNVLKSSLWLSATLPAQRRNMQPAKHSITAGCILFSAVYFKSSLVKKCSCKKYAKVWSP